MRHLGLECYILSEGTKLEEYSVSVDDEDTISCFIASEAGKSFEMYFRSGDDNVSFRCRMDGRPLDNFILRASKTRVVAGLSVDSSAVRPFLFSNLTVTDDDSAVTTGLLNADDLGSIEVRIHRVTIGRKIPWTPPPSFNELGVAHEKTKKAGIHCVSLAGYTREVLGQNARRTYVKSCDPKETPFSRFLFKYRPREMLQAQGIIPLPCNEEEGVHENGTGQGNNRQPQPSPRDDQAHRQKRRRPVPTEGGVDFSSPPSNDAPYTGTEEDVKLKLEDVDAPNMVDDSLVILKTQFDVMEESMRTMQENMRAVREKMERLEAQRGQSSRAGALKKEPSPIRLGASHGDVIDLTDD